MEFDYIVVGAGSSGCVLANRLSEDPSNRVCLIEAGPEDRSPLIHVPAGIARLWSGRDFNWGSKTVPQPHANNRELNCWRGKVMGGSSSINGMIYSRGHPGDYDQWAELGNAGWSFREVLPYFTRSEHNENFPESPYHGRGGPLNVKYLDDQNPLTDEFLRAGKDLRYPVSEDSCGPTNEGFGRRQANQLNGRRHSAAAAFIQPIRSRSNLTVLTSALARRVLFDGRRARGLEIEREGVREQLTAKREVVLAAGAIGSPHLLMLSGVGTGAELASKGIPLVHNLPGVGLNFQDHAAISVQYLSKTTAPFGLSPTTAPKVVWNAARYLLFRKGMFASGPDAGAFIRSDPSMSQPDLQMSFTYVLRDKKGRVGIGHGFGLTVIGLKPDSSGHVKLASPDPRVAPLIDPKTFSAPADLDVLVHGLKIARRILQSSAFDRHRGVEVDPGPGINSAATMADYVRRTAFLIYHPIGTCKMGTDPQAVVDADLRVHGLEGIRVADASIMPSMVRGNTNAPAIMIGEKAADLILGKPPLPPARLPAHPPALRGLTPATDHQ